jgi:uncharacterized phage protein gp47/JayE
MPLLPSFVNPSTKLKLLRNNIQTDTAISNFQSDSKMNAMIAPVADEISEAYRAVKSAFDSNSVSSASKKDLDAVAARMGVQRRSSSFSSASKSERIIAFYTATSFGAINGGADIVLSNVSISTDPIVSSGSRSIEYVVDSGILPAASGLAYVSARAKYAGGQNNVGKGSLVNHDFSDYVDFSSGSLRVVNLHPILNGSYEESDQQLRFRLSRLNASREQVANDRIFLRSIEVPGVADVRVGHAYYGIGTVGVFVLGAENQTNASMVDQVQSKLSVIQAPGMQLIATAATEVSFDIEMDVFFNRPVNQNIKDRVSIRLRSYSRNLMRAIGLGGSVSFASLENSLKNEFSDIITIGTNGSGFKKIFMRRGSSNGLMSQKEKVIGSSVNLENYEYASIGLITINFV